MSQDSKQAIKNLVKVDLNKNQIQALTSFIDNQGVTAFKNSNLLKTINRGDFESVPTELNKWVMNSGRRDTELESLRQTEIDLFTKQP
jgi:lysozyme